MSISASMIRANTRKADLSNLLLKPISHISFSHYKVRLTGDTWPLIGIFNKKARGGEATCFFVIELGGLAFWLVHRVQIVVQWETLDGFKEI